MAWRHFRGAVGLKSCRWPTEHAVGLTDLEVDGTSITAAGYATARQLEARTKAWKRRFKRRRLAILCRAAWAEVG